MLNQGTVGIRVLHIKLETVCGWTKLSRLCMEYCHSYKVETWLTFECLEALYYQESGCEFENGKQTTTDLQLHSPVYLTRMYN